MFIHMITTWVGPTISLISQMGQLGTEKLGICLQSHSWVVVEWGYDQAIWLQSCALNQDTLHWVTRAATSTSDRGVSVTPSLTLMPPL